MGSLEFIIYDYCHYDKGIGIERDWHCRHYIRVNNEEKKLMNNEEIIQLFQGYNIDIPLHFKR